MISSDFRRIARERLNGKWGKAVCITLAYLLIAFIITFIEGLFPEEGLMANIISIAVLVIEIPLAFGLSFAFFKLFYGQDVKAFNFWKLGFDNFKKSWGISFNTALKLLVPIILIIVSSILLSVSIVMSSLGILDAAANTSGKIVSSSNGTNGFLMFFYFALLIVGVIWSTTKSYYYQLTPYVAFDNPDLTPTECVLKSQELMTNNRWKLFCLQFSFIGWAILTCFTLGIGLLWLVPYVQLATIAFYDNIANNKQTEQEVINEY